MGKGKRNKSEKEPDNTANTKTDIAIQEKREKRQQVLGILWKIWWIGVIILFGILAIQTYMIKFGS